MNESSTYVSRWVVGEVVAFGARQDEVDTAVMDEAEVQGAFQGIVLRCNASPVYCNIMSVGVELGLNLKCSSTSLRD